MSPEPASLPLCSAQRGAHRPVLVDEARTRTVHLRPRAPIPTALSCFAGVRVEGAALTFFASVVVIRAGIDAAGDETQRIGVIHRAVPNVGIQVDPAPAFTIEGIFTDEAV